MPELLPYLPVNLYIKILAKHLTNRLKGFLGEKSTGSKLGLSLVGKAGTTLNRWFALNTGFLSCPLARR